MKQIKGSSRLVPLLADEDIEYEYDTKNDIYTLEDDEYQKVLDKESDEQTLIDPRDASNSIVFTPAAILDLLSQITELDGKELAINETLDGKLQLTVGDSVYQIEDENSTKIEVEPDVVDDIDDANVEAYQDLLDQGQMDTLDNVEGGIIKNAIKSLLLGGIIRFAKKNLLD